MKRSWEQMMKLKHTIIGVLMCVLSCVPVLSLKGANECAGEVAKQPHTTISLLAVPPYEAHIWTIYGHAAVRVVDSDGYDRVYNWGVFDFDKPGFIRRFVAGTSTDYMLAEQPTDEYIYSYASLGCDVYELTLNLTDEEAARFLKLVEENLKPENRFYRYNFVFDNCATRPILLLEQAQNGKLMLPDVPQTTRRAMIDRSSTQRPWLKFGTDMVLGRSADTPVGAHDQLFLPLYMKDIVKASQIMDASGSLRAAVAGERIYPKLGEQEQIKATPWPLQPLTAAVLLLLITLIGAATARGKAYFMRTWGAIVLAVMGLSGCLIFFLTVISLHPLTAPNWTLAVLHPLHLLVALPLLLFWAPSRVSRSYHLANIIVQMLFLLICSWATAQHFHPALYLISVTLLVISLWAFRYGKLISVSSPKRRRKRTAPRSNTQKA